MIEIAVIILIITVSLSIPFWFFVGFIVGRHAKEEAIETIKNTVEARLPSKDYKVIQKKIPKTEEEENIEKLDKDL